jgi:hypothetical protein
VSEGFSRRCFLASAGAYATTAFLGSKSYADALQKTPLETPGISATKLQAITRTLQINGKAATVMGVQQSNGTQPRVMVRALSCALASGSRDGNLSAV